MTDTIRIRSFFPFRLILFALAFALGGSLAAAPIQKVPDEPEESEVSAGKASGEEEKESAASGRARSRNSMLCVIAMNSGPCVSWNTKALWKDLSLIRWNCR